MKAYKYGLALLLLAVIVGCNDKPTSGSDQELGVVELLKAPLEIELTGGQFRLEAFAWRDFEPPSHIDGKPLIVFLRLIEIDSVAIEDSLNVTRVFAVFDDEIWETIPTGDGRPTTLSFVNEFIVRNGPMWGPDVNIDIVVEVRDIDSSLHLIRISEVPIIRTA